MNKLYASPLRVYFCLGIIAIAGIFAGLRLPVSLFPNSAKPLIGVNVSYGDATAEEFLNNYGRALESQLKGISTDRLEVEQLTSSYEASGVDYKVQFKWGAEPKAALREVESIVNSFGGRLPKDIRDSINIWARNDNSGFLAVSFYSQTRDLDALYELLEPLLVPKLTKVQDAQNPDLWNPSRKEVRIELVPETMASLGLLPKDIDKALQGALAGYAGGSVTIGTQRLSVQMPRASRAVEDLRTVLISTPSGRLVHLGDIARIDLGPQTSHAQSFKTSGAPSLILFAQPRPGGNVKRMSEDILEIVRAVAPTLPKDVEYRVLVDPSEFIRSAVNNVFHEVILGALLAVGVLFLFIGSLRNVITAAIEIPLSMVLAFILMKVSGMNLNLISLGGLALSAGMNVDASVVVMENIFRHFESVKGPIAFSERLEILSRAVSEVRFSVIASTIASLVVFLPLAFTSDLSYAILGDLAKTVVFSHGFSAIVALVLVPTVRLHLMSRPGGDSHPVSPIEKHIKRLEDLYGHALSAFIGSATLKRATYGGVVGLLLLLALFVLPRLPKEILGTPDTDWMMLGVNTKGNTLLRQMESQAEEVEARLLSKFGSKIQYTFNQISGPNRAWIMSRLKSKRDMTEVWHGLEAEFSNTPLVKHWVAPWNPAELPIPNPPQMRIAVRGGSLAARARVTQELDDLLETNKVFPNLSTSPDVSRRENIFISPHLEQWQALWSSGARILPSDLADLARVATNGRKAGEFQVGGRLTNIMLRFPESSVENIETLAALPVGVGSKLVPLKALASVSVSEVDPPIYREDERELFLIEGKQSEEKKQLADGSLRQALELVNKWKQEHSAETSQVSILFDDAEKDLHEALQQLGTAVALSVLLIFLTLVLQFGDIVNSGLVLVAVPLGFIGVLLSLFIFRSTLSLNSILGVILLNGISVANSIILVDFLKRLVGEGMSPREAAALAARKRLRPILITSATTVLGMLPIAFGMGEGGRILQPLGIAVTGGLWFSMGLTLFIVPALQVAYLERRAKHVMRSNAALASEIAALNRDSLGAIAALRTGLASSASQMHERLSATFKRAYRMPPPDQWQ